MATPSSGDTTLFHFTGNQPLNLAPSTTAMSFNFTASPSLSPSPSPAHDDSDGEAMDLEFEYVHGELDKLTLSDEDMGDSDSDSNFTASSSSSSSSSTSSSCGDGEETEEDEDHSGSETDDDNAPNSHIPPHFTSLLYLPWLRAQTPNITFTVRMRPLVQGSMVAAHSTRLWYRDFVNRAAFLQRVVDEYQLLGTTDISGFVLKERRTHTWVEFGADEASWVQVLERVRSPLADENLTGSAMAVRVELRVLVGGGSEERWGKVVEKGRYGGMIEDDPDL